MAADRKRLAIFNAFSGTGGVERVVYNLLEGLSAHDIEVDLLAVIGKQGELPPIPWPNIRVIKLPTKHSQMALFSVARYLREQQPAVLMVAKDRAIRMSVLARWLSGVKTTRLVGWLHMNMSGYLVDKGPITRWLRLGPIRWLFPHLDLIVGVSEGVVDDAAQITGLPRERMLALPNPVLTPEVYAKAEAPSGHPWLDGAETVPVILGAGRLSPEKDFATMLRAFRRLRDQRECRLVIIGEGPLRANLEKFVAELGLQDSVSLPGHTTNPYAYMKRAALLAFSSIAEGSGNVLIEAMALGTPVVSTDCPYGPSETLAGGRYGALVPVGDDHALAAAMLATLEQPLPADTLRRAVAGFSVAASAERYLHALGFATPNPS
jgi:glycosyltransferase involved in cell wall biosynthesis